ncbi:MFS transporter [Enterovibrio norvegicus]|uniref:MFS transporter n=1 Tax=Enterovibrio norvegicus TaxID=188144 RepID=UPI000C85986A|nr:MFS transporter [Enterovibrio norvegicus]PML76118.1 MFS transporter [Enterovibrio norvegicus]PMN68326.1 MFS transporter [Enterovibrio norvegicus]
MSLLATPFVDASTDTVLHVIAAVVLVGSVCAIAFGFWKIHELPVSKAKKKQHQQMGLITALTWIGFLWHWVWVVAVIVAFVDSDQALRRIRDIWREPARTSNDEEKEQASEGVSVSQHTLPEQGDQDVNKEEKTNA